MDVPAENQPFLPFEIIVTILMFLPAEDLVRFMLVCIEWRDLIKDAGFILKHLQVSALRGNNYLLCGPQFYLPLHSFKLLSDKSHVKALEMEIQYNFHTGICKCIYSSGGLLLLYDRICRPCSGLYLFNPFIQKCKSIKSTSFNMGENGKIRGYCYVIGFGYHSQANDFKIVRLKIIRFDFVRNPEIELEVYSLSTDSWKRIEVGWFPKFHSNWENNFPIQDSSAQVMVHDCFHWLAFKDFGDESRLLAFDLGKEAFQAIKLPDYEIDEYDFDKIVVYKDKLSLMVIHHKEWKCCCSFWVLTEYGVLDSWSRLFNVDIDERIEKHFIFTRHDELIFRDENAYVVHNVFTQKRQYIDVKDIDPYGLLEFLPLTNSLTLIDSK